MREIACQFGAQSRLSGVITLPSKNDDNNRAMILVSAGLLPKSGPFRLYVNLARKAAEFGISTLRFDLGGIGNSEQIDVGLPLRMRTNRDISAAVDQLSSVVDAREIILGGLCSGAEDSFRYAERDARVTGVIMIDPHAYRSRGWSIRNVLSRRFLNRLVCKFSSIVPEPPVDSSSEDLVAEQKFQGPLIEYNYMDLEESSRILRTLISRNVWIHYLYTGGRSGTFNHRGQLQSMFKGLNLGNRTVVDYVAHIEHVQLVEEDQQELIDLVLQRLNQQCP